MLSRNEKGSGAIAVLLAIIALAVSVVAVTLALNGQRAIGRGLAAYDLSTPQAAVRSGMLMEANGDLRARMEMEQEHCACEKAQYMKAIDSLAFDRTMEYGGKTLVFFKFNRDGVIHFDTQWLDKAADGRWHEIPEVPIWTWTDSAGDRADILKAVKEWEAKNGGLHLEGTSFLNPPEVTDPKPSE